MTRAGGLRSVRLYDKQEQAVLKQNARRFVKTRRGDYLVTEVFQQGRYPKLFTRLLDALGRDAELVAVFAPDGDGDPRAEPLGYGQMNSYHPTRHMAWRLVRAPRLRTRRPRVPTARQFSSLRRSRRGRPLNRMIEVTLAPLLALAPLTAQSPAHGDEFVPLVEPASDEGAEALARFELPEGFEVSLFAAEPDLANPVCFAIDGQGRFYVGETFRHYAGVTDIRSHMDWLNEDLACKTVADRVAMKRRHAEDFHEEYELASEQVRRIVDSDGDGVADESTVFATGFDDPAAGIGAGLLPRGSDVYYTCIPDVWRLTDADDDGVAEARESLHRGYGVRVALLGHDLHGLEVGPDGLLYFSIGDRGFHVESEGRTFAHAHTGAVLRCELDGSNLEVFATGLRNPQELVFDDRGDLFTGDNNSDGGDKARWVWVLEGSDSGWRQAYQWITQPNLRGPWNAERMWHTPHEEQPAHIHPPIANVTSGPSGLCYYPGTGWGPRWRGTFFLCDFRGNPTYSGVYSFRVVPRGAGFELVDFERFLWNSLVTDVDFAPGGDLFVSDWVSGWNRTGKGRLYRVHAPAFAEDDRAAETSRLLAGDWTELSSSRLAGPPGSRRPARATRGPVRAGSPRRGRRAARRGSLRPRAAGAPARSLGSRPARPCGQLRPGPSRDVARRRGQ